MNEMQRRVLQQLDLKGLVEALEEASEEISQALSNLLGYEQDQREFLAGRGQDCPAVRERLAVLAAQAPQKREDGKPTTLAEREAWLQRQRSEDELLAELLKKQREVEYGRAHWQQVVDDARRRHGDLRAIMELRSALLRYLASGGEDG